MEEEIWKPLVYKGIDYSDTYKISNFGRLKNIITGHVRKLSKDKDGYLSCGITKDGHRNVISIHRAVAELFIGGDQSLTVNHKDGNKDNNRADNLEYMTALNNINHAVINGLYHHHITTDDIKRMKEMRKSGCKYKEIAEAFNITKESVKDIILGRRHVLVQRLNIC